MASRILILGGGTGGTLVANRLLHACGDDVSITVVDRDDDHVYQPGLLFVPFGMADAADLVRSRRAQLHGGIRFRQGEPHRVDVERRVVELADATELPYDVLVIATGATLQPDETEGLTGAGWMETAFTFYDLPGAQGLRRALDGLTGGRLVVNVVDMPIKCPVAPLEFCFLADWQLRDRGLRDEVEISFVTPLDGAFTRPVASGRLGGLLQQKGIELVTEFATGEVDGTARRLTSFDGRTVDYDLLVTVPVHGGAEYVRRSEGLGDAMGFVPCNRATLQSDAAPNVFVIGDAANVPASKAGSVTHFEGEVVVENIRRFLDGRSLEEGFDGHANCFIETGFHKALLIDFNYDVEPLPGRYPREHMGLPLLRESRLNHLAKLAFQWIYWHMLLPGRDIPGIGSAMPDHNVPTPTTTATGEPA